MKDIIESIKQYSNTLSFSEFTDWGIILIALLALYFTTVFLLKIVLKKQKLQRPLYIYIGLMASSSIVLFTFLLFFIYKWKFTDYYINSPLQLIHIITILVLLLIPVIIVLFFRFLFERASIRQIISFRHSRNLENMAIKESKKVFFQNKFWLLLPFLAFMLIFFNQNDQYLVSFVIDNSSSMGKIGSEDISPIELGKSAIGKTIQSVNKKTLFVLNWFNEPTKNDYKTSLLNLTSCRSYNDLCASNFFFENKQNAFDHLQNLCTISSTPLYEGIWSNFLFCKNLREQYHPKQAILIIISDGNETSIPKSELSSFMFCNEVEFDKCFDKVSVINLAGDLSDPIFVNSLDCGYFIEENGLNRENYSAAVDNTLKHLQTDYNFILILFIFLVFFTIIVFLIPPKKY